MSRKQCEKAYTKWHWGIKPLKEVEWNDPDLPDYLIETGRLVELHYKPLLPYIENPNSDIFYADPDDFQTKIIKLNKTDSNKSHLAFDPKHKYERLYILSSPAFKKKMKKYWQDSPWEAISLKDAAKEAGGKHGKMKDYPNVKVRPIGVLTHVTYACEKKGDGYSFYIHHMGEESGIQPWLVVDRKGKLYIAGGNYTSPTAGITD